MLLSFMVSLTSTENTYCSNTDRIIHKKIGTRIITQKKSQMQVLARKRIFIGYQCLFYIWELSVSLNLHYIHGYAETYVKFFYNPIYIYMCI